MLPFTWSLLRRRGIRNLLLLFGVMVVSGAFGLLVSTAETTTVTVDQDLADYWRTTYDILVRPPGAVSPIEVKYDRCRATTSAVSRAVSPLSSTRPSGASPAWRWQRLLPGSLSQQQQAQSQA